MKTCNLSGAAEYLKCSEATVLELAGAGELSGAKIGKAWVFREDDLDLYLSGEVELQTSERRAAKLRLKDANRSGRRPSVPRPPLPQLPG